MEQNIGVGVAGASPVKACERCGDLFYHPKALIEDQRQRALEWEDEATAKDKELSALRAENTRLIRDMVNFDELNRSNIHLSNETEKLRAENKALGEEMMGRLQLAYAESEQLRAENEKLKKQCDQLEFDAGHFNRVESERDSLRSQLALAVGALERAEYDLGRLALDEPAIRANVAIFAEGAVFRARQALAAAKGEGICKPTVWAFHEGCPASAVVGTTCEVCGKDVPT